MFGQKKSLVKKIGDKYFLSIKLFGEFFVCSK